MPATRDSRSMLSISCESLWSLLFDKGAKKGTRSNFSIFPSAGYTFENKNVSAFCTVTSLTPCWICRSIWRKAKRRAKYVPIALSFSLRDGSSFKTFKSRLYSPICKVLRMVVSKSDLLPACGRSCLSFNCTATGACPNSIKALPMSLNWSPLDMVCCVERGIGWSARTTGDWDNTKKIFIPALKIGQAEDFGQAWRYISGLLASFDVIGVALAGEVRRN